jgi:5,10-methylenetetrahydrofolate reductase
VIGDTVPHVDHLAHHYEIVEHLTELQEDLPDFEVGMPTRFREWQFRRRIELGAQFFVTGPILDPEAVEPQIGRLKLRPEDPPVFVMIIPPFSPSWVEQMEAIGAVPVSEGLKRRLSEVAPDVGRKLGWTLTAELESRARDAGAAGVILMGLKFESVVNEAVVSWPRTS